MSAATATPTYVPSPVPIDLTQTVGPLLLGTLFEVGFYGMVVLQVASYFKNFPADRTVIKLLVGSTFFFASVTLISHCNTVWFTTVQHWGNTIALVANPWSYWVSFAASGIMAFLVQGYYAYRVSVISVLTPRPIVAVIVTLIMLCALLACGLAVATAVITYPLAVINDGAWWTTETVTWYIAAAATDLLITTALVTFMHKARTGFPLTENALRRWTILCLETNGITAAMALISAVLVAKSQLQTSNNFIYAGTYWAGLQLYPLSMLAVLNSRTALRLGMASGSQNSGPNGNSPKFYRASVGSFAAIQSLPSNGHWEQQVHPYGSLQNRGAPFGQFSIEQEKRTQVDHFNGPKYPAPVAVEYLQHHEGGEAV